MVILIWCLSLLLLLLWSAAAWALRALLLQGPGWLDTLPQWIARLPYPAVLERWLPNWQDLLVAAAHLLQALLGWMGSAGVVVLWVTWACGTLVVLGMAALLSWAVRQLPGPPPD